MVNLPPGGLLVKMIRGSGQPVYVVFAFYHS